MCGGGVRSNAKECKACYKWVHYRCHVANNGIGWNEDPKKSDYRCPKCLKNIAGVIQKMMTKRGIRLRGRREKSGAQRGAVLATKGIKRKVMEKESNWDTNENKKQKHTGKTYTEEEVNKLKKQWIEENKEKIANMRDEDKNNESNILDNSIFRINKTCIDCDEDYEATYDEIGRLNCYICGLTSHGCKHNEKGAGRGTIQNVQGVQMDML